MNFLKNFFGAKKKSGGPVFQRNFAAANSNRLLEWAVSLNRLNGSLRTDWTTITLRARDLALNNEFVAGFLKNLKRNVIGAHGFTLQSKANPEKRAEIENLWREYSSRAGEYVALSENMSGRDFDILVLRTLAIDGEVFIRKIFDPASKFGWRYEVLDSIDIDPDYCVEYLQDGGRITMGIRYDAAGREVSYFYRKPRNSFGYKTSAMVEIPAGEILHIFCKEFPGQARGFSWFSPVAVNLGQLDSYKEAEIVHARIQACVMGIWERDGTSVGDSLDDLETNEDGVVAKQIKAGSFDYAPKGYKANFLQNTSPNNQFGIFWKNILRSISNALGISYNKSAGDYESVNYSSLREASLEDRASYEEIQTFLVENWKDVQFENFVGGAILNGLLKLEDSATDRLHKFFGRRFPWVDPSKEIAAKEKELDLLLTDPISELEARGIDPDEHLDRWAEWYKKTAEKNIPFMVRPPLEMNENEVN